MNRKKVLKKLERLKRAEERLKNSVEASKAVSEERNKTLERIAERVHDDLYEDHVLTHMDAVDALAEYEPYFISRSEAYDAVTNNLDRLIDIFSV